MLPIITAKLTNTQKRILDVMIPAFPYVTGASFVSLGFKRGVQDRTMDKLRDAGFITIHALPRDGHEDDWRETHHFYRVYRKVADYRGHISSTDALGNEIILGGVYGFSVDYSGVTDVTIGKAVKETKTGVTIEIICRRRGLYNIRSWVTKKNGNTKKKVTAKAMKLFPVSQEMLQIALIRSQER